MSNEVLYRRVYFARGATLKGTVFRYHVKDPPAAGWHGVLVLPGPRNSTLFDMFTFWSQQVSNESAELYHARPAIETEERLADVVEAVWKKKAEAGAQVDYDTAAIVLTRLGRPVPTIQRIVAENAKPVAHHGKPLDEKLLRPMNRDSRRGAVLAFFLEEASMTRPVREAMVKLELTRSGVLSHLFTLNKNHGVGYDLLNDVVRVIIPEGWDPFAVVAPSPKTVAERTTTARPRGPTGKPVRPDALRPITRPSRRADVAEHFLGGGSLEAACQKMSLTRSAVLSHLFSMNKDNGVGYEVDLDAGTAKLLVPDGHTLFIDKGEK